MTDNEQVPVPGRRERKKRETRAALAAAALRLALEKGPDNVTVEEISEAADVSARTFFNYFSHKEHAILGRDPEHLERALSQVRNAPPGQSPLAILRLLASEALADLEDKDGIASQRVGLIMRTPTLLSHFVILGVEDERELAAALAERMGGPAASVRAKLIVGVVSTAVRVAMEQQELQPDRSLQSLVDEAFQLLADGLDPAFDATTLSRTDQKGQS
ncbi:transcriptional regulator, TetR family [Kribbella flavida DSM 17836]|uniref:Transcriptional regulator, TetR family n=1 Tax=Kribbella flavida (strain DSM 17836 / JCM 10339 / NBRC 14399) TaxID=479435 RepID=D2PYB2_KRIFD|nr:TetR family transcriptional regulator [Kribbella flavida]ADB35480.1 transcriptional regulator, TetR family [Kribbella flavida DSM 17836]